MATIACPDCGLDLEYVEIERRYAAAARVGDTIVVRWWDANDADGDDGILVCPNGHKHGTASFGLTGEIDYLGAGTPQERQRWDAARKGAA